MLPPQVDPPGTVVRSKGDGQTIPFCPVRHVLSLRGRVLVEAQRPVRCVTRGYPVEGEGPSSYEQSRIVADILMS